MSCSQFAWDAQLQEFISDICKDEWKHTCSQPQATSKDLATLLLHELSVRNPGVPTKMLVLQLLDTYVREDAPQQGWIAWLSLLPKTVLQNLHQFIHTEEDDAGDKDDNDNDNDDDDGEDDDEANEVGTEANEANEVSNEANNVGGMQIELIED